METRANYVVVGSFVLVILLGIFIAILWLGHVQFNRQTSYYDIYFAGSVTGLNDGAAVTLNGVAIGRVIAIRPDPQNPEQVRVTVEIDPTVPIKQDAVASLELQSFVSGVAYVEVSGGSRDAPPLQRQEGQRYPVIASRPSQLQSVVANAPEVLSRLILVADRLAELLDDKNRAAISATLDNAREVTAIGVHAARKLDPVIDDADATLKQTRTTMVTADEALVELKRALAAVNGMTGDLSATVKQLNLTLTHLDLLIQENRPGLHDFTQAGLDQLQQLIIDTRGLVAGLSRVASAVERDPARFLFGEHREGYKPQ